MTAIPFVIDNKQHKMADVLNDLLDTMQESTSTVVYTTLKESQVTRVILIFGEHRLLDGW